MRPLAPDRQLRGEALASKLEGPIARPLLVFRDITMLASRMWRTLAVTARFQPLSSKALGEHSSLDPFSVARAIDALRKRGLINRNIDPADKRRVILTTTKKGDAIYHDVARFAYNVEQALTSDLTKREKESFDRILSKIERRISEMTAQSDWKDYFEG